MKNLLFILMALLSWQVFAQEHTVLTKNHFEISAKYAIQRPFYSVSDPVDIIAFTHTNRYRSRFGVGCKYYVFNSWFLEYNLAFSQEGGGYSNQFTNTNYLKNSINIGFSSSHKRRIIFDIYTGFDLNVLMNSNFKNKITGKKENVTDYHNRFVFSFPTLGIGVKTRIYQNIFLAAHTYASMTTYRVSKEQNTKIAQVIFPAFQISLSKFLQ